LKETIPKKLASLLAGGRHGGQALAALQAVPQEAGRPFAALPGIASAGQTVIVRLPGAPLAEQLAPAGNRLGRHHILAGQERCIAQFHAGILVDPEGQAGIIYSPRDLGAPRFVLPRLQKISGAEEESHQSWKGSAHDQHLLVWESSMGKIFSPWIFNKTNN